MVSFLRSCCRSFNTTHHYQGGEPLEEDVVVVLDPDTGEVVRSWGRGLFLLPHGVTVDDRGNTWLTDVALHQVFKVRAPRLTPGHWGHGFPNGSGCYLEFYLQVIFKDII